MFDFKMTEKKFLILETKSTLKFAIHQDKNPCYTQTQSLVCVSTLKLYLLRYRETPNLCHFGSQLWIKNEMY